MRHCAAIPRRYFTRSTCSNSVVPIATFMDFCTELDELRTPSRTIGFCVAKIRQDSMKKPRRSGAKFLAGACPSRGKANPPIHYHSWLSSGDFAEKAPPEGAGPSWSRLSDEGCRREANRQRQATTPTPLPTIGCTPRGRVPKKSPAGAGLKVRLA